MSESADVKTMRAFIDRQSDKLRTIEGSIDWRNGYGAALDSMSRVLDALAAGKGQSADTAGDGDG